MFFSLLFVMPLCASVYLCLVVTCWEGTDLLALVCHFPIGILGQMCYLIVSIPDLSTLTYFDVNFLEKVRLNILNKADYKRSVNFC